MVRIALTIYGVLLLAGGYFGKKAGSKVSLYAGIISGAIVLIGVGLICTNGIIGFQLIAAVSGLLGAVFLIRLIKTKKFMPSGMLLLLSMAALFICVKQLGN